MRNLIILMLFLFITINASASAKNIVILENLAKPIKATNINFGIDKNKLGRAWLTIDILYNDLDSFLIQTVRAKFSGLRHDVENQEILLDETICATTEEVTRRRLFRKPKTVIKINDTGLCNFRTYIYRKEVTLDDGFDIEKEKRFILEIRKI